MRSGPRREVGLEFGGHFRADAELERDFSTWKQDEKQSHEPASAQQQITKPVASRTLMDWLWSVQQSHPDMSNIGSPGAGTGV